MLIDIIAGARPNFMKIAPIIDAIEIVKTDVERYGTAYWYMTLRKK